MTAIITPTVANRLVHVVERFRHEVQVPAADCWKKIGNGDLWASVLGQIAVVGSANSGLALKAELGSDLDSWWEYLRAASAQSRRAEIHTKLRKAGVRYVRAESTACEKTKAAVYDFEIMESHGGPRRYFEQLASVPVEFWRIAVVAGELAYIKNKGARDLLIELGLVQNAIAFDTRLKAVLQRLGANLPEDLTSNPACYKSLEQELLSKVCIPCSITGGHLDRILFNRSKEVT
jgi:hypothetical protein